MTPQTPIILLFCYLESSIIIISYWLTLRYKIVLNQMCNLSYYGVNTPIRGLSTILKKRLGLSLSCRFLEYVGNERNLIGEFRRLETKEH